MAERIPTIRPWLVAAGLSVSIVAALVWWQLPRSVEPGLVDPPILAPVSPAAAPPTATVIETDDPPTVAPAPPMPRLKPTEPVAVTHAELVANPTWTGDLDGMVKRRVLRMLLVPNRTDYYLDHGEPKGLTAEYARELERRLNLQFKLGPRPLRVAFVPVTRDRLIPALLAGEGDVAVANLTITPERLKLVDFSPPFLTDVREIVVTGPHAPVLRTLDDLAGQEIQVRRSSSYWSSLEGLDRHLHAAGMPRLDMVPVPEPIEDEDLLELVDAGMLPLAVVDEHKARAWAKVLPALDLRDDLVLRSGAAIGWAYRKRSPKLAAFLATFAKATARGTEFGNVVAGRYLVQAEQLRRSSPADRRRFLQLLEYFRRSGDRYRFDPLLLAAQGFQESGLDQKKRSRAGAIGIMQLRPETARDPNVDIRGIDRVENNIEAGAKYLRHLIDVYFTDPDIGAFDRMLFALAAYNAGPTRIADLRRRAGGRGLDPDRWFGQVELQAARDIGREPVTYVGNIVKYYVVYRGIVEQEDARTNARSLIVAR